MEIFWGLGEGRVVLPTTFYVNFTSIKTIFVKATECLLYASHYSRSLYIYTYGYIFIYFCVSSLLESKLLEDKEVCLVYELEQHLAHSRSSIKTH